MYVFLNAIAFFSKDFVPSSAPTCRPCEIMWNDIPFDVPSGP